MVASRVPRPIFGACIASILVLAIFGVILVVEHRLTINGARSDAKLQLEIHRRQIEATLDRVETDVAVVVANPTIQEFAGNQDNEQLRGRVGEVLRTFAAAKRIYDQIRVIDENGMELVRVNRTNSGAMTVPAADLQDKADRYYVVEGLALKPDEWYISPFDLNIEGNAIELPRKPMIRLVRPLDIDGERHGLVVLNYRGDELFASLRLANADSPASLGLANAAGWWLYVDDPEREWLFMFPDRAGNNPTAFQDLGNISDEVFSMDNFAIADRSEIIASSAVYPFRVVAGSDTVRPWYLVYQVTKAELGIDLISQMGPLAVPLAIALLLGGAGGYVLFRSLRQRNDYRQKIEHAAFIDELTRLPNRRYLYDQLRRLCEMTVRYDQTFAVLFIDIDGFKPVNDQYGHDAGDVVLVEVARRLQVVTRTSDLVARLGGDEFVVCAVYIRDTAAAENVASKILSAISIPVDLPGGNPVGIGASIGIYGVFDLKHIDTEINIADEIIRRADTAMYEAKRTGKNKFAWAVEQTDST